MKCCVAFPSPATHVQGPGITLVLSQTSGQVAPLKVTPWNNPQNEGLQDTGLSVLVS